MALIHRTPLTCWSLLYWSTRHRSPLDIRLIQEIIIFLSLSIVHSSKFCELFLLTPLYWKSSEFESIAFGLFFPFTKQWDYRRLRSWGSIWARSYWGYDSLCRHCIGFRDIWWLPGHKAPDNPYSARCYSILDPAFLMEFVDGK